MNAVVPLPPTALPALLIPNAVWPAPVFNGLVLVAVPVKLAPVENIVHIAPACMMPVADAVHVRPYRNPGQDGIEIGERIAPRIVDRENGGVAGDGRR